MSTNGNCPCLTVGIHEKVTGLKGFAEPILPSKPPRRALIIAFCHVIEQPPQQKSGDELSPTQLPVSSLQQRRSPLCGRSISIICERGDVYPTYPSVFPPFHIDMCLLTTLPGPALTRSAVWISSRPRVMAVPLGRHKVRTAMRGTTAPKKGMPGRTVRALAA